MKIMDNRGIHTINNNSLKSNIMKKLVVAAMAVITALFTGCSKDSESNEQVKEGVPTYVALNVTIKNPSTRTETRSASQNGEKEVQAIDIYVFNANGVLETIAANINLTPSGAGYKTNPISTTTGAKTIYALANNIITSGITTGMSLSAFEQMVYEAVTVDATTNEINVPIAVANSFFMLGSSAQTLAESSASDPQQVSMSIMRAAAKSQLLFKNVHISTNFKPENVKVNYEEPFSQLAQLQTKMYVALGDRFSSNDVTPWLDEYTTTDACWKPARLVDFDANNSAELATTVEYSHYTAENVHDVPRVNNTTCMIVRIKGVPTQWTSEDGTAEADGSFYAIVKYNTAVVADQKYKNLDSYYGIYKDEATAQAVLSTGALSTATDKDHYGIIKYTGGLSYYRLNLRDMTKSTSKERYSVLRNHFYKVAITEINNIGWNNPKDLVDPDDTDPVEADASLEVTITVDDWTDVDMNEPLG